MTKFSKIVVAASLILVICILTLFGTFHRIFKKDSLNTIRILTPTWITEKFQLNNAAEQFMKENPGVKVIVENTTNYDSSYYPLINTSFQDKYDIILGGSRENIVLYAASGTLTNFDTGFFDDDFKRDDFFPSFLELGNINGHQYMIPLMGEVMSLVIRKDLFKEAGLVDNSGAPIPPKDWEQLYSYAQKLTTVNSQGKKVYGLNIDFGNNILLPSFYGSLQSKRGNIFDNTTGFIDVSSDDVKYLLDIWSRLVKEGLTPTYTFEDVDAGRNNFKGGTVAMLLSCHSRWAEAANVLGKENVGIMFLPNAEKNGSLTYVHGITIPSSSPNRELAIKFIKGELLSRNFQAQPMNKYGKIPSLVRNYDASLSPEWNSVLTLVRNSSTFPIYKDWAKIDHVLQLEMQKCITGKQTTDEAVNNIKKGLEGVEKATGF